MRSALAALVLTLAAGAFVGAVRAGEDVRAEAQALIEQGKNDLDAGLEANDTARVRAARDGLRKAKDLLTKALQDPKVTEKGAGLLRRDLVDLDVWLKWAEEVAGGSAKQEAPPKPGAPPGVPDVPERKDGSFGPWLRQLQARYAKTESPVERAILARHMGAEAGVHAIPVLVSLFRTEADPKAREGVHEALALVGTSRVPGEMEGFARNDAEKHWANALDVLYRGLERPERAEPEKPWCRAIRAFHELKERKLTLRIVERLDAMGTEGIAALGEVLYVEDIGYHDHTIGLLAKKRDRRAVPPLVFKLNRFAFEAMEQMPAHKALLAMGWYAVPELIDHLDDKAAGIWISWTLRKITGETMGTDKRKWHDWWKSASVHHPELFDDPEERPGGTPATGPTTPSGK